MKRMLQTMCALMSVGAVSAMAQPPSEGSGTKLEGSGTRLESGHGPVGGHQGPGGPHFNPIMDAVDQNGDHELSASEISAASTSLGKLDKNGDGQVDHEEIHPRSEHGNQHGEHGQHGDGHMTAGGPPGGGGRGPGGPGGPPIDEARMLSHAMQFDKDADGMLSSDEMKAFISAFAQRHGGQGGARGGRPGGRGRGGPGEDGGRPQRPSRPE